MNYFKTVLDTIGFGAPLIYSMAVFFIFRFVDRRTSMAAKRAASSWLRSEKYNPAHVSTTLTSVFDAIYTYPLWGWRAILRSAIISAVVTTLVIFHLFYMTFYFMVCCGVGFDFSLQIGTNLVADYLSLYVIRYWFTVGKSVILTLMVSLVFAVVIVLVLYTMTDVVRFSLETWTFRPVYFWQGLQWWFDLLWSRLFSPDRTSRTVIFIGAIAVHLWLPFFALSLLVARGLNSFRQAVTWMQWFLKRGNQHPFEAIGYVAACITFVGTILLQYAI